MNGRLAKRIHSMQESIPNLSWGKARRMYADLMGWDLTGQHPKAELTARERRATARRLSTRKTLPAPLNRLDWRKYLATCGGVRPGPHTKVAHRQRYIRRSYRLAQEQTKAGEVNALTAAFKDLMSKVSSMFTKSKRVTPPPVRHQRGRG